jgi:tetratricopeptide (TPR) repeat protein
MVRQAQKRFDEALALFEQQSAMPPEAKMPMADAHTLLTIGNVHYVARRRGQAVTYWQQAQAAAQADGVDFVRQMPFLSRVVYHYEGWFQRLFPNRR